MAADKVVAPSPPAAVPPAAARVDALDALRGAAALLIFVYHYFALYPLARGTFEHVAGLVLDNFAMGVPLFFALSGLSLCLGFYEKRQSAGFLRDFFRRRFLRIAPLFYLCTLAWVLIFWSRGATPGPASLVATSTFVFNLLPGQHESVVQAGWSIGVEMLFYVLFPLIIAFVSGVWSALIFFLLSSVVSVVCFRFLLAQLPQSNYAGLSVTTQGHYFAVGILIYFIAQRSCDGSQRSNRHSFSVTFVPVVVTLVALTFLLSRNTLGGRVDDALSRIAWAIPIGAILLLGMRAGAAGSLIRSCARLGEWSYSLYLLHPIVLYFVFEYLKSHPASQTGASVRFAAYFVIGFVVLLALSAATFSVVERPFLRLGRRRSALATQEAQAI